MRVICAYTDLRDETAAALDATTWHWEAIDVSESDTAYLELLTGLWGRGETFALVEHDVAVRRNTLDELATCASDWCCFPIPYMNGSHAGLGCVKFDETLMRRVPNVMDVVWQYSDVKHEAGHWCTIDHALRQALVAQAALPHLHEPPLFHVRDYKGAQYPSHDCWTRPEGE